MSAKRLHGGFMNPALAIAIHSEGWVIVDGLAIESSSAMTHHVISVMEKSAGPLRSRLEWFRDAASITTR
jgi:hypothetical protein